MPGSIGLYNGVLFKHVQAIKPNYILDVGCGSGTYSEILKAQFPDLKMDAIEATESYWEKYNLEKKYEVLYKMPIQDFMEKEAPQIYDLTICFDVLEHLYLSEAIDTIECLSYCSRHIILAWPTNVAQGCYESNPYEKHKSNMQLSDLTRFDIVHYEKTYLQYENRTYLGSGMYHYALIKTMHGMYEK